MKRFLIGILILASTYATAQTGQIVHGKVVNATDGTIIEMATIRLFGYRGTDSTLVQGAQTDMDGKYWLGNVSSGRYKIYVSSIGFVEQSISISVADATLQVPTIQLKEDVQALAEVDVKGKAAEMTVKGDTIEYNTAAYKVGENAMVEDLLKKMNGVEVDKEGNVTVNGEEIKGVRIDGKKFFGNDVQSATKNIPAEMIEKVQVIDEKSDMAKITGFEDDDTERIINLTLKKDRRKGVFGNYNAGLGMDMVADNGKWFDYANLPTPNASNADKTRHFFSNDFRYNAGMFTNILLGSSQTTIIGSANNTNDIRSRRGRGSWGGQNAGITWSENIGVNTNVNFNEKINKIDDETSLLFGGDGSLNHSNNDTRSISNKESYSNGVTFNNADSTNKLSKSWDVNVRLELEYQIDTLNKLLIRPRISYTNNYSDGTSNYIYTRNDSLVLDSIINDGYQKQLNQSEEISSNIRLIYNHKFYKPGRAVTLNAEAGITDKKGYLETYAHDNLGDSAKVDQHTNNNSQTINYQIKASYIEPIFGRNHFLETALTFSGNSRFSQKDQFDNDPTKGEYIRNEDYSNRLENRFYSETLELNYRWIEQAYDLTVGMKVNPSQTHTKTYYGNQLVRDTLLNVWNFTPNATFKYKFGKKEFARIIYRGRSSQPTIQQMEPVRNNSNAMNETVGNLGLQPAFGHNLFIMYSKYNQDNFSSLMTGLRASLTKDALVNNSIYDETGKLYQQTVNAKQLPWQIGADFMFNTPFANKLMQFNTRTAISYNQQIAYITHDKSATEIAQMIEGGTFILGDLSQTGNLRASEDLTLRLTHDIVDVGLRGNFTYSRTQNTLRLNSISNVFNWSLTGDVMFHLPKSWNISADCGYTARYGYNLNDVNEVILNASIDKSFGNGTLELKVFDLLHSKKNIVQTIGENYIQYQKCNTLPTYFMLTFTYRFNKMGDMKATGMGGHIQEMIESGANPAKGKMPQGPPPFMR
ncbi:MAG: TonB-dependent receptor [Bacteroidales bacterium]|nr:TonB-dependent receptor [Candidatus Colicola coprequi]